MNIAFVEIQNFRKHKACRLELDKAQTILVGANNSGKTSAIDAMILFLKKSRRKDIATTDFTLSNWSHINQIGTNWINAGDENRPDFGIGQWLPYLPSIDIWLNVTESDIHYVVHLLPTLDWTTNDKLGVRLALVPKNTENLYKDYTESYQNARKTESSGQNYESSKLSLWPESMRDFLDRKLNQHFEVKAYILDPARCLDPENGIAIPQLLSEENEPLIREAFDGIFKIDVISAQRGFSDPKTEDDGHSGFASLSTQLRQYFKKHLNPSESPDSSDIEALQAIEAARSIFDEKLKESFKGAIGELEMLNYPGFSDPKISLTSRINPEDSLDHKAAVQFNVLPESKDCAALSLPEQYNGLGYQNLISMVFNLIRFRDEWMRVGKAGKIKITDDDIIEPLHIVLIEEPEAHLHAQVQQVFIKKAYNVLRDHSKLKDSNYSTQMIVSTHSSHIAHELDFTFLRYFRREPASKNGEVPYSTVINLSKTFGDDLETSKFATRYIKTTHCDLFFADAAILIEGAAERMLIPHFLKKDFPKLNQSYICLLEIGGSHAHRLRPLIETLGITALIITDLDSVSKTDSKTKTIPERNKGYKTGNTTLKEWLPGKTLLDDILDCQAKDKQSQNEQVMVAYQCPVKINYKNDQTEEAIPYTFEDSLALSNLELFRSLRSPSGLLKKIQKAIDKNKNELKDALNMMFESLKSGSKAEMALELLYLEDPAHLKPPQYISEGLKWLEKKLDEKKQDFNFTCSGGGE